MAEHVVFSSHFNPHTHGNLLNRPLLVQVNLKIKTRRKFSSGPCKNTRILYCNAPKLSVLSPAIEKRKLHKERALHCYCLGSLQSNAAPIPNWIYLFDQGLLMTSMFLTYMVGVIPVEGGFSNYRKSNSADKVLTESSCYPGSTLEDNSENDSRLAWDTVGRKLSDSVMAMDKGDVAGRVSEIEQSNEKRPSSLSALAVGPKLRLLWACFQWLRKQVHNVSGKSDTVSIKDIEFTFKSIIQDSCRPLCMTWLEEELRLKSTKYDKALFTMMVDKFNGYDNILQNIKKSGKEDLYLELICYLRFGFIRENNYYGHDLLSKHSVDLLEDLVITLADGIANMYLELVSVDSSMSNEVNSLGISLCTLSTRALQKLRNEVALHQWLHQNMEAIVSILYRSEATPKPLYTVVVSQMSVSVKRIKELRALSGWRYFFSLFLELSDIAMPVVRTVIAKISDAISFFLVSLIGRSLGLIYTGIRESLRWK
ncbi:hypothetical protein Leryth_000833 [Lithospermum erythrorhizon]|nr:hypothetical protein Leryth_000833 [Lithospermum erythrorhizon]